MVIGQEQDGTGSTGGYFDAQQGWSGKLTQVEIWDTVLPNEDIIQMAKCQIPTTMESNQVVSWLSEKWIKNNVTIKLVYICAHMSKKKSFLFIFWQKKYFFINFEN